MSSKNPAGPDDPKTVIMYCCMGSGTRPFVLVPAGEGDLCWISELFAEVHGLFEEGMALLNVAKQQKGSLVSSDDPAQAQLKQERQNDFDAIKLALRAVVHRLDKAWQRLRTETTSLRERLQRYATAKGSLNLWSLCDDPNHERLVAWQNCQIAESLLADVIQWKVGWTVEEMTTVK
jgi:hypothetical protein